MTADELRSIIQSGLACEYCALEGDGRHWYATIVSRAFEGKRAVQRHQLVYATLGAAMGNEIHALALQVFTPEEFADQSRG